MSRTTTWLNWSTVLGVGLTLSVGCSGGGSASSKPSPGGGTTSSLGSPLEVVNALPAIRVRLNARDELEAHGEEYGLAALGSQRDTEPLLPNAFSVAVPRRLYNATRLLRSIDAGTWLEISALGIGPDCLGTIEKGLVVYRAAERDLDLVESLGSSHFEELRVLRSGAAPTTWQYSLQVAVACSSVRSMGESKRSTRMAELRFVRTLHSPWTHRT
jgi:hypothetical protein